MTIILVDAVNEKDIDNKHFVENMTKSTIQNNDKLEEKLNVIIVVSNPCLYKKRYKLANDFINRIDKEHSNDVNLYIVELAYGNQKYYVTKNNNPNHLQIRTNTAPLWHKENMINIGIRKLLPKNWKAVAWVDADIEFENPTWAIDTLKILNGHKDIVQVYSHAIDMDNNENAMTIFSSFGFQFSKGKTHGGIGPNFWHPGFAWAMTRTAYEKAGGLFDLSILGSGDHNMALSLINKGSSSVNSLVSSDYKKSILDWQDKAKNFRLGYVPGVIRHYFHGTKQNRKYAERWQILVKHDYNPEKHVTYTDDGLLVPTNSCPKELLDDIMKYFKERNEDDF
jgi:hypothetical protein